MGKVGRERRWSVVSGQWSVVSGQWSIVSGQLLLLSDQLSVVNVKWMPPVVPGH